MGLADVPPVRDERMGGCAVVCVCVWEMRGDGLGDMGVA